MEPYNPSPYPQLAFTFYKQAYERQAKIHFCCRKMSKVGAANGLFPQVEQEECLDPALLRNLRMVSAVAIPIAGNPLHIH